MTTRSIPFLLVALAGGCIRGPSTRDDSARSDSGSEADADTDTDADTDADADADTDADADADTDTDCTELDLRLQAEVAGSSGPCTECSSSESLVMVGIVRNPCDEALDFRTVSDCLVSGVDLDNLGTKESTSLEIVCKGDQTDWPVPPSSVIQEEHAVDPLDPGEYRLTVTFNDRDQHRQVTVFQVVKTK